jgi:hypothetical protein
MTEKHIEELLERLDGVGSASERKAVSELRALGAKLPERLRKKYHQSRTWKVRCACVFYSLKYARDSEEAIALGLEALHDKAKVVRYRACMLLAYSQRANVLPELRGVLESLKGQPGAEDIAAAIDAIEHQNHHYFVDRDHSGRMTLTVE